MANAGSPSFVPQHFDHPPNAVLKVALDLEIPEPQHMPAEVRQLAIDASIALTVALDLRVPELP